MVKRPERTRDSKRYYDWLYHAHGDLESANRLKAEPQCYLSAAFHCQQCVEKSLKAFVLFRSGRLLDGHNLTWLCRQAVKLDKGFSQWLDESAYLNHYYIETRYPADIALVLSGEDIDRACAMAGEVFAFICAEADFRFERYRIKGVTNRADPNVLSE